MNGAYRSRSRLVMDVLAVISNEQPVGVTRLLQAANMTHGKLLELLESFEKRAWVSSIRASERTMWSLTELGQSVLKDLHRVDAVMQDHGLGL